MLADRPPWFGSVDRWQAGVWGLLVLEHGGRVMSIWLLAERPADLLHLPLVQNLWLLSLIVATLLVALSQIIMNAQRLEYELRAASRRLAQELDRREAMDAALRESEETFRLAFANANVGLCLVSPEGRFMLVNQKICEMFGYSERALLGMHVNDLTVPTDLDVSLTDIQRALAGEVVSATFEERYRHRTGYLIEGLVASSLVRGADGAPRYFISQIEDISARKHYEAALREARDAAERTKWALHAANEQLQQLATTDMLTGAWNRRWFEDRLAEALARAWRQPEPLALVMFDLDHFKQINDTQGHAAGDAVLIELVRRVSQRQREVDVLARWGGEEFVLLLTDCPEDAALRLAEEQRARIAAEPFPRVGQGTASFGVVVWRPEEDAADWFRRADDALYAAKRAGRNRVCGG